MVTEVPPPCGPWFGLRPVTVGAATYVNLSFADVADVAAGFVTVTSTVVFAVPTGDVAVIVPSSTMLKVALVPPNFIAVAVVKLVPVMVTRVPPAAVPDDGDKLVTVGG